MKTNATTQNRDRRLFKYKELVERIYNEHNMPTRYKGTIESMLREFFFKTSKRKYPWKRDTFKSLLIHLYDERCYALLRDYNSVTVLHNISSFGNRLVRPVEEWRNDSSFESDQLGSLIRHCFARYETPKFLETSFFGVQKKYMLWYVQLGGGRSVKDLSQMPVSLTRRMAHAFREAPEFLAVPEALRYAQAIGFGAASEPAKLIALSRLSMTRDDDEVFWAKVVQFFAKEEDLKVTDIDSIVDYLAFKYRQDNSFSMKNRTMNALMQQTEEWHRNVYLQEKGNAVAWGASGIKPLYIEEFSEDKKVVYKTVELLDSGALYDEGLEMQHCVAEYDSDCYEGLCAIFSLQKEVSGEPMTRLATIEITLPDLKLVQAKARYNAEPDDKSKELLDRWIRQSKMKQNKTPISDLRYGHDAFEDRRREQNEVELDVGTVVQIIWWGYILIRLFMLS